MRTTLTVLVILSSLALGACASGSPAASGGGMAASAPAMSDCAMCARGEAGASVWCERCKVGYVAGEKVTCPGCFAAKTGGPPCPTCSAK